MIIYNCKLQFYDGSMMVVTSAMIMVIAMTTNNVRHNTGDNDGCNERHNDGYKNNYGYNGRNDGCRDGYKTDW